MHLHLMGFSGANVTITDLAENLPLLRQNIVNNKVIIIIISGGHRYTTS
jgi:hypothetical protein